MEDDKCMSSKIWESVMWYFYYVKTVMNWVCLWALYVVETILIVKIEERRALFGVNEYLACFWCSYKMWGSN